MTGAARSVIQARALGKGVDLLALHRRDPGRYPHLLESAAHGTPQGRYDILFAFPGETLVLDADGLRGPHAGAGGFLRGLDAWWAAEGAAPGAGEADGLPFLGGWFVYLGYEMAGEVEPTLELPEFPHAFPRALATRFPAAVIRDHREDRLWLVAEPGCGDGLATMAADVRGLAREATPPAPLPPLALEEEDPARHLAGVERVRGYIHDGHVFQANLSRAWRARAERSFDAATVYDHLRRANPGPFAALATLPGGAVISSSPERLISRRGDRLNTRPIAGTRPRGTPAEDEALKRELIGHPKERAEHVMLIDLERNDLGRVCRPGSVVVDELMVLETYQHVHHIVSSVSGEARDATRPGELLAAVFPGGTITGCPKVRCMEILAELEGEGRGPYTGALGYVNRDGSMDTNILIRTLFQQGRELLFRAGGGVVADSDPERELDETRAKARGLLAALGQPL